MKAAMGVTNSVRRAFMADLCLKLGEKAASGEKVPQRIGITNPVEGGLVTWMLSHYFLVSKAPSAESSKAVATVTDSQRLYSSSSELSFSRTKWRASAPSARRSGGTSTSTAWIIAWAARAGSPVGSNRFAIVP
jgi:hypothetical protein